MTGAGPFTGAWRRAGLLVDGARVCDRCDVLWLQSPSWYTDIRVPRRDAGEAAGPESLFARTWAFGGMASWDPPVMTWQHLLDSDPEPGVDANRLELDGGLALERGEISWAGRATPFCEEWQRISPPDASMAVQVDDNRIAVRVGSWRLAILDERPLGAFRAGWSERQGGRWRLCRSLEVPAPG